MTSSPCAKGFDLRRQGRVAAQDRRLRRNTMKLVVYGPDKKLGALQGDQVVDLNFAYAKYLGETQNEPLPHEMAAAVVPHELGSFIESGPRAVEGAQAAVEYLTQK